MPPAANFIRAAPEPDWPYQGGHMSSVADGARAFPHYDPTANYAVDVRDLEYRRDGADAWLLRLYQPRGRGPFPMLVDVHGGVWSGGDRTSSAPRNEALAATGLLIAALDFR